MGLFNFMKKRRERESAVPGGLPTGEDDGGSSGSYSSDGVSVTPSDDGATHLMATSTEVTEVQGLGALGQVLNQALTGNPTVMMSNESQVVNLQNQGDELRNSILETLKTHGIDAEKGQAVEIGDPAVAQEIMGKLSSLGLDPAHFGGPAALGLAGQMGDASTIGGDSISRLERLGKLHGEGVLTDAEFADQKRKILGE